jgi:hypothetical protein
MTAAADVGRQQGEGMTARTSLTIVLAAGEGTRMRSTMAKVLHPVGGQSLLAHVLGASPKGAGAALAVVIGPDHEAVALEVKRQRRTRQFSFSASVSAPRMRYWLRAMPSPAAPTICWSFSATRP